MVSRPTWLGGLGFGLKWDMGWMHDTLHYLAHDTVHRKYHHDQLTFRMLYAFTENFVLSLSHDEIVHGKGSLLTRMPGDDWQKFANLRLLLGYMYAQPGKKLLFMGAEIGQGREWNHDASLDWDLLQFPLHQGVYRWLAELGRLYLSEPALHERDLDPAGFQWIDASDTEQSVLSFLRKGKTDDRAVLVVCNFTPVPRHAYHVGVPDAGFWKELLNSDSHDYGGSGQGNFGGLSATPLPIHGRPFSLNMTLPPLGIEVFRPESSSSV
jgi:1,4-alpha-glucan branching enzyme